MGTYQGGFTVIKQADGLDVFYIDLTQKKLKRGNFPDLVELSTTEPTTLKTITFKIAGIKYTESEIANNQISYEVAWIKSFASVEELKASLK